MVPSYLVLILASRVMIMVIIKVIAIIIDFIMVIILLDLNPIQIEEAFKFQFTFLPISKFIAVAVFMEILSIYQDFILTILEGMVTLSK